MTRKEEMLALRAAHPELAKRCDDADDRYFRELFIGLAAATRAARQAGAPA